MTFVTPAAAMLAPLPHDADTRPAPQPRDLIAGLEKGLAVICAFDQERPLLSVTEVAERCGLTRAAARRYLTPLIAGEAFPPYRADGLPDYPTPRLRFVPRRLQHRYSPG